MNSIVTIPLPGPALASPAVARNERRGLARSGTSNPTRAPVGPSLPGFVAGPENRLANAALYDVLAGGETQYSPLFFYGPAGCGKTHLAQGLVRWWEEHHPESHTVLLSGGDFAEQFAAAIEREGVAAWRSECRTAGLFVLEDLAQLANKRTTQQELCHTLDALERAAAVVLVTSRTLPGQMSGLLPGLSSRLSAGLAVPLALPGAGARRMILESLVAARGLRLTTSATHLLADSLAGSVPALAGTLLELESACAGQAEIGAAEVGAILTQRSSAGPPTLRAIATQTARHFHLTLSDLKSPLRRQALVAARGVAFVLARQMTDKSLDQIGTYFGGRDHTTVLHACRRTEKLSQQDPLIGQAITSIKRLLTLA